MQPLAHYHTAACTLPYSRLHTTIQLLAHNHAAACTRPCSRLRTTMQPLAHYYTAYCTLPCRYKAQVPRCSKSILFGPINLNHTLGLTFSTPGLVLLKVLLELELKEYCNNVYGTRKLLKVLGEGDMLHMMGEKIQVRKRKYFI